MGYFLLRAAWISNLSRNSEVQISPIFLSSSDHYQFNLLLLEGFADIKTDTISRVLQIASGAELLEVM